MSYKNRVATMGACVLLCPWIAAGQAYAPGTPPDLDRRVFVDVNSVTPNTVLDQLCDRIACTLDVDRKLPQPDISLQLSNVRARTALDAVCDIVGCRWSLKGRTLVVTATSPPPAVPKAQQWVERMKVPLAGEKWNLDRVPLRDVLGWLSQELDADVSVDGPDGDTPVTDDLRGRTPMDAVNRIQSAVGYRVSGATMRFNAATGRQEIRFQSRKEAEASREPGTTASHVYKRATPGLTLPKVVSDAKPYYTKAAMEAKVQGTVVLAVVVEANGSVGDVKVLKALRPDLDQEAIRAAKKWSFVPGTKDGKPVPVEVTLELTFTLRDKK